MAFDQQSATKYTNFGSCTPSQWGYTCGEKTGLYLTPIRGLSCLQSVRFCTANDIPERDPLTITIEGSNQTSSELTLGSSWTLIYNGSSGLDTDPGRQVYGQIQHISNYAWYRSYRILATKQRGYHSSIQYAEIELKGY